MIPGAKIIAQIQLKLTSNPLGERVYLSIAANIPTVMILLFEDS